MAYGRKVRIFIRNTERTVKVAWWEIVLFHKYTAATLNFLHPISCEGVPSYDLG